MAFGVDTADYLSDINWANLKNWKGEYPNFAGRYFYAGYGWSLSEFATAKQDTNGMLNKIHPIQGAVGNKSRLEATGSTGYKYGVEDANAIAKEIETAVVNNKLQIPPSGFVNVYLDVETGVALSTDYWAGWAYTLWHYNLNGQLPFFACIYAQYVRQSDGTYSLNQLVKSALDAACEKYPDKTTEVTCDGLWTAHPQLCSNCIADPTLDWTKFNEYNQPCGSSSTLVPLLMWQYATPPTCVDYCKDSSYAGGENLDMDETNDAYSKALNYMLVIP
ncbi:MAG: hypothetical protein PWP65_1136 [Clostridia bacterium]|nr:hypothetical protein [Clostridia bacterium]